MEVMGRRQSLTNAMQALGRPGYFSHPIADLPYAYGPGGRLDVLNSIAQKHPTIKRRRLLPHSQYFSHSFPIKRVARYGESLNALLASLNKFSPLQRTILNGVQRKSARGSGVLLSVVKLAMVYRKSVLCPVPVRAIFALSHPSCPIPPVPSILSHYATTKQVVHSTAQSRKSGIRE